MFKASPTGCSNLFFSRLNDLARKTQFIQRTSAKFSASGYLFSLIRAILTGKASFNQLAMGLKKCEAQSLSKQSLWKGPDKLEDSTQQKLPKSNYDHFPAHGNGHSVTAGVKINLAVDILHGHTIFSSLHGATEQDRDLGKTPVDFVKKKEASELYRCRWNIEIIFRAWKQSANLDKALNRRSNETTFKCSYWQE